MVDWVKKRFFIVTDFIQNNFFDRNILLVHALDYFSYVITMK